MSTEQDIKSLQIQVANLEAEFKKFELAQRESATTKPNGPIVEEPKPVVTKADEETLGPGERWMTPKENRAADKAEARASRPHR